jgi:NADPH:quinone reductase
MGFPRGGFWAEYVIATQAWVAPIPKGLDMLHAAALPATGLTALQGVDDALHVKRGESVIVHGASGGVGSIALQFAKLRGARVLATASGKDGVALARRLGADAAVDGRRDDIAEAAAGFAPDGVDAILAFAGGPELTRALDALRRGGRVGHPNGVEPAPRKRRGITIVAYDGLPGLRQFRQLNRAAEAARLDVPLDSTYPMTQAVKCNQRLAKGHVLGKIVLRVR